MKARHWHRAALAGAALLTSPCQARQTPPDARVFVPTSEWRYARDSESCRATRDFVHGDQPMKLQIQAFSPDAEYKLAMVGKALPDRSGGLLEFQMAFNPDDLRPASGILASTNGVPLLTFRGNLRTSADVEARRAAFEAGRDPPQSDGPGEARETAVDELALVFSRGKPLALQLGSMKEPAARLRQCGWELVGTWGFDEATQRDLARRPVPMEMDKWFSPGMFPANYWRASLSAMVHLRLDVEADGKPAACVIQAPKAEGSAEAIACGEIMKNARFQPALDSGGNAVPSYFTSSVFFIMPRRNGKF